MKFYHDTTGLIHLVSACMALVLGTWVLAAKKGSRQHQRVGYIYTASMLVLNITAFGLYHLFGGFGPFHIAALISLLGLVGGMVPVFLKKPRSNWLGFHFSFMYYSVIGLYAAFASEVITRVVHTHFGIMVGIATFLVMGVGTWFYRKNQQRWTSVYQRK